MSLNEPAFKDESNLQVTISALDEDTAEQNKTILSRYRRLKERERYVS